MTELSHNGQDLRNGQSIVLYCSHVDDQDGGAFNLTEYCRFGIAHLTGLTALCLALNDKMLFKRADSHRVRNSHWEWPPVAAQSSQWCRRAWVRHGLLTDSSVLLVGQNALVFRESSTTILAFMLPERFLTICLFFSSWYTTRMVKMTVDFDSLLNICRSTVSLFEGLIHRFSPSWTIVSHCPDYDSTAQSPETQNSEQPSIADSWYNWRCNDSSNTTEDISKEVVHCHAGWGLSRHEFCEHCCYHWSTLVLIETHS